MIDWPSASVSIALPLLSLARWACTSAKLVKPGVADEVDLSCATSKLCTMSAPIGWEKTNMSSPLEPVRWSSPDQAKIGEPGA